MDTPDEIVEYVAAENPQAIMFRDPDFYDAIIGYVFNEDDLPVLAYDYNKMIESLAAEYDGQVMDAIEWIEYNTLRTLPYIEKEGRPIIVYN